MSPCKGKSLTKELFFCSFLLATRCIRKMQCWRTVLSIGQNSSCFCLFRWYYSRISFKNTALSKKCRNIIVAGDVNLIRLSKKMTCHFISNSYQFHHNGKFFNSQIRDKKSGKLQLHSVEVTVNVFVARQTDGLAIVVFLSGLLYFRCQFRGYG